MQCSYLKKKKLTKVKNCQLLIRQLSPIWESPECLVPPDGSSYLFFLIWSGGMGCWRGGCVTAARAAISQGLAGI